MEQATATVHSLGGSHLDAVACPLARLVRVARPSGGHGNSAAGNCTRVFRVTGGNTDHYTTTDLGNAHEKLTDSACSAGPLQAVPIGHQVRAGPWSRPLRLCTLRGKPTWTRSHIRCRAGEDCQAI